VKKDSIENPNLKNNKIDIVYEASHDLKGPLRTIKSFTQLLDTSMGDRFSPEEKGLVGFIMEATDNLDNLVSKLIDYSKAGLPAKISELKIANLLQLLVLENKAIIDINKATVNISCDDSYTFYGDKRKITILFQNLLSNSLKFINKTEPPQIEITVAENNNEFHFKVKDNGIGIAEEKLDIVFELFERIHGTTDYKGARIGLATCKKIVEVHNGNIKINSELGKYTEVKFTLPKGFES